MLALFLNEESMRARGKGSDEELTLHNPSLLTPHPTTTSTFANQVPQEGATLLCGLRIEGRAWENWSLTKELKFNAVISWS